MSDPSLSPLRPASPLHYRFDKWTGQHDILSARFTAAQKTRKPVAGKRRVATTAASAAATKLAAVVAADESLGVAGKVARAHLTAADFPPQQRKQHWHDEAYLSAQRAAAVHDLSPLYTTDAYFLCAAYDGALHSSKPFNSPCEL